MEVTGSRGHGDHGGHGVTGSSGASRATNRGAIGCASLERHGDLTEAWRKLARRQTVPECEAVRSWFVIPALGVACGGAAIALGITPVVALAGAAFAAAVRAMSGESPAALAAAAVAPLLAVASFAEAGGEPTHAALALAAAGWTVVELARPASATASPLVAVLPATVAAVLDPSFVALIAITGLRLITTPWQRPRWVVVVPVAGVIAILLAVVAGTRWPGLGLRWFGAAAHPVSPAALAALAGAALGPLTAVAAIAGLAGLARARYAELALAAAIAGAILVDLRAGAFSLATIGLAALLAGLAIGRLAAIIRISSGQAVAGATAGLLVVLPPVWTTVEHRSPAAHTGHASR